MNLQKPTRLKKTLDRLYSNYREEFLSSPQTFFEHRKDPLQFPHRYKNFHDIEAAAFIASTFAYGNVTSLCNFIGSLLSRMGDSPASFLKEPDAVAELKQYRPYYRLHKEPEILQLLKMLSLVYSQHGSLYEIFKHSYYNSSIIQIASMGFVEHLRKISGSQHTFLLPDPSSGSPCKRLNLFLRWMVRRDGMDLGLWKDISPSHLIMPLDTHIGRVSYKLGWISTPSLSWKKAEAITDVLRKFDPADPTRYDFALCHESMEKSEFLMKLIA